MLDHRWYVNQPVCEVQYMFDYPAAKRRTCGCQQRHPGHSIGGNPDYLNVAGSDVESQCGSCAGDVQLIFVKITRRLVATVGVDLKKLRLCSSSCKNGTFRRKNISVEYLVSCRVWVRACKSTSEQCGREIEPAPLPWRV